LPFAGFCDRNFGGNVVAESEITTKNPNTQDFFQNNRLNIVKKEIKFILFCSLPDYTAFFVGASIQSRDLPATSPRPVHRVQGEFYFGTKFVILFFAY